MDVLLLTTIDPFSYQIIPDLGLMYLAAALREAGIGVEIRDCRKDGWDYARLSDYVANERPLIVGIKSYSHEVKTARKMAKVIHEAHTDAVIVIGGPQASMDPEGTLSRIPDADYAFIGEAEESFSAFAKWVKAGRQGSVPLEVTGIAFRDGGKIERREPGPGPDLAALPLPAWDLCPPDSYPDEAAGVFVPEFPAAPMALSRGCPFNCAYCGCRYIMSNKLRYRPLESMLAEIDLLARKYGVRTFTLVDDNFTWDRKRALEFFQALAEREDPIHFTFPNGIRVDSFDEELLKTMEAAGCKLLALGIESGSDETLARMQKRQKRSDIEKAVKLVRSTTSIKVTGFFILGYPGETIADVKNTIDFAVHLPIHHAHFCLFMPIPGTPVYSELIEQGVIDPKEYDYDLLTIDRPSLDLPGLPPKKLLRLHQYAYLRFYLEPWRVASLLSQIKSPGHLQSIYRRFRKLF